MAKAKTTERDPARIEFQSLANQFSLQLTLSLPRETERFAYARATRDAAVHSQVVARITISLSVSSEAPLSKSLSRAKERVWRNLTYPPLAGRVDAPLIVSSGTWKASARHADEIF